MVSVIAAAWLSKVAGTQDYPGITKKHCLFEGSGGGVSRREVLAIR